MKALNGAVHNTDISGGAMFEYSVKASGSIDWTTKGAVTAVKD